MKKCKLGDIAYVTKLAGFEFTKYVKYNETGEIIALRALNLRNGMLDLSDVKRIDRSVSDTLQRSKLFINDILLTYTGNGYGDCAIIEENDKYHLAPNVCKITPNTEKVEPYFLYCLIRNPSFKLLMSNYITGSSQPTIPMKTIRVLEVMLPDLDKQKRIASLMEKIDNKIDNNSNINKNLEQQAFALFSEAQNSAKDYTLLSNIAEINPKRSLDKGTSARYIDMSQLSTSGSFPAGWNYKDYAGGMKFKNGDTIMARITPCLENGKTAFINFLDTDEISFGSTEYIVLSSRGKYVPEYFYCLARYTNFVDYAVKNMNGSSGRQRVAGNTIGNYELGIPSKEQLYIFNEFAIPAFNKIKSNALENMKLINIREALLPRLMSGEIDVSDIDL